MIQKCLLMIRDDWIEYMILLAFEDVVLEIVAGLHPKPTPKSLDNSIVDTLENDVVWIGFEVDVRRKDVTMSYKSISPVIL